MPFTMDDYRRPSLHFDRCINMQDKRKGTRVSKINSNEDKLSHIVYERLDLFIGKIPQLRYAKYPCLLVDTLILVC